METVDTSEFYQDEDWKGFIKKFFDNSPETLFAIGHDGFDTYELKCLTGRKKEAAFQILMQALEKEALPSSRVIEGLSLEFADRSSKIVGKLKEIQKKSSGSYLITITKAIQTLENTNANNETGVKYLTDGFINSTYSADKINFANAMGDFYHPRVIKALLIGVTDSDYLVRYHCANVLLTMHSFDSIESQPEIFSIICEEENKNRSDFLKKGGYAKAANLIKKLINFKE